MVKKSAKMTAVVTLWGAFFLLCRFLQVSPLYLSMLAAWGGFCFLFSFELAGSRRRIRNGIEDKTPLQRVWMIAGLICVLTACAVLFLWF